MADTGRNARGIASNSIRDAAIIPRHLSDSLRLRGYHKETLYGQPMPLTHASGVPALPTASQGQINYFRTAGGLYVELFQTTAQTLMPLESLTLGLEIGGDKVDNESLELVPGGNSALSPFARVVGTSQDFFFRCRFKIADVSGLDQFMIGYRKVETAYAVPTGLVHAGDGIYTDYGGLLMKSGDVFTLTDLNNSGVSVGQDSLFNWADNGIHELMVKVTRGGKLRYFINGVELGGTVSYDGAGTAITAQPTRTAPAFTFDTGDTLVPFIFLRHDTTTPSLVYWQRVEIGLLSDIGEDRSNLL